LYQDWEWREGASSTLLGRRPSHFLVEAACAVVLFKYAQPGSGFAGVRQAFEDFVMNDCGQPGSPGPQGGAEVEKFVVANGREADDRALLHHYEDIDLWTYYLLGPSRQHRGPRKRVRMLREYMSKADLGTRLLHVNKFRKVCHHGLAQKHAGRMTHDHVLRPI
jgi:hypothetical protein